MFKLLLKSWRGDLSQHVSQDFQAAIKDFDGVRERFRSLISMCDERKGEIVAEVAELKHEDMRITAQQERVSITLDNFDALLGDKVLATGDYVSKD